MIKNLLFFIIHIKKMGFCCKILSLNDLTLSPINRPGTGKNDNREAIPILHVKYRAQLLLGVGWGGMPYCVYLTLSCHN